MKLVTWIFHHLLRMTLEINFNIVLLVAASYEGICNLKEALSMSQYQE